MSQANPRLLFCSDLDRTLIPNGPQTESPSARPLLHRLAERPEVTLVYVSGRDQALLQDAIRQWQLPRPDYAIGDVGTTIYRLEAGQWQREKAWDRQIAPDWNGCTMSDIAALVDGIDPLMPQEPAKQNRFKRSYYAPPESDRSALLGAVEAALAPHGIRASLIWSIDEATETGLLDILPAAADKLSAIRFLQRQLDTGDHQTLFCGDSGNDLPVLASGIDAVLVANATDAVRQEALALAQRYNNAAALYLARGGVLSMNGNYAAGAIEGLLHFHPEARCWFD